MPTNIEPTDDIFDAQTVYDPDFASADQTNPNMLATDLDHSVPLDDDDDDATRVAAPDAIDDLLDITGSDMDRPQGRRRQRSDVDLADVDWDLD